MPADGPLEWPTQDLLTHRVQTTPEKTAIVDADSGDEWTYEEFDEGVHTVAEGLEQFVQSVESDDRTRRLGVLMETRVEFATVYVAAMRRGMQLVLLNVRETAVELEAKVERTGLAGIVCEAETEDLALEISPGPVVSVDESGVDGAGSIQPVGGDRGDSSSYSNATENPSTPPLDRHRTHLIAFTSGTSGEPKAVRLTVGNLVASATASAFRLGVLPEDRWLCCLPMYHVGGLAPIVRSVLYGTTVVIQRTFDPEETARVLEEYEITGVSLVPTMLTRLFDAGWAPSESLRFVLLGGAPASAALLERCIRENVPVYPTYGMTETASQVATATPAQVASSPGTVGQPLVCTSVSVVEDGGSVDGDEPRIAGPNEPGELVVSGPTVTPGYLDDDATDAAFSELGLHTGDIGYRDEAGRLWVLDRRTDRIVTGGENVDPGEVVDALESHRAIEAAAVVGLTDEQWGERVGALLVPRDVHAPPTLESVAEDCRTRLAGFKVPKTMGVVAELPRTHSGTVDREAVREHLRELGIDVTET